MTNQALPQHNLPFLLWIHLLFPKVQYEESKISDDVEGNWWNGLVKGLCDKRSFIRTRKETARHHCHHCCCQLSSTLPSTDNCGTWKQTREESKISRRPAPPPEHQGYRSIVAASWVENAVSIFHISLEGGKDRIVMTGVTIAKGESRDKRN